MTIAALFVPAKRGFSNIGAQFLRERTIMRGAGAELLAIRNDFALKPRSAHAASIVR
jgi:hypothetical protein